MRTSPADRALRVIALLTALVAVVTVTLTPTMTVNSEADARPAPGDDDVSVQQRESADAVTRGYAFLLRSEDHRYPARWCPGEIPYRLDLSQAIAAGMDPIAEQQRWADVFAKWAAVSGGVYSFRYAGEQELRTMLDQQLDIDSIEPGSIGITYVNDSADAEQGYQAAAVQGRTAGNGGLQVVTNSTLDAGALVGDRGFVMIDADDAAELAPEGLRRTLYQHESGHALGLGHVSEPTSLMNGTLSTARAYVSQADEEGLLALTRMPCTAG